MRGLLSGVAALSTSQQVDRLSPAPSITKWSREENFRPISVSNVTSFYQGRQVRDVSFLFDDHYKFGRRLTVAAHGTLTDAGYAVIRRLDDSFYTGTEYAYYLSDTMHVDFRDYDSVRLLICHAGHGGESGFAADFATATGVPTKSYIGEVATNGLVERYVNLTAAENIVFGAPLTTDKLNQALRGLQNQGKTIFSVIKNRADIPYRPVYFDKYGLETASVLSPE